MEQQNKIKTQIYKFVFVNTNMGYNEDYNLVETNIPLSCLSSIESSQKLTRSSTNCAEAFTKAANSFYYEQGNRYMKIVGERTKEPIEGYPLYYGFSGNY